MGEPLPAALAVAIARDARLAGCAAVEYHTDVESTNDLALERAAAGAPEGTAVIADLQRAGRGRRGRTWFSPAGAGVYLSMVTRPPQVTLSLVTLAAGVASARGVTRATGLPVHLKWPNDLVVGSDWRKLGGVLCETSGLGATVTAVVVGIGLNVRPAAYPPEVADRAASIEGELGRLADRATLIVELLAGMRGAMEDLRRHHTAWIPEAWRALAAPGSFGRSVRWTNHDGDQRGVARDINDDGALVVEVNGRMERLVAGEVLWERQR